MSETHETTDGRASDSTEVEKPLLLKAIEPILGDPAEIKRAARQLHAKYQIRYEGKLDESEIQHLVAKKIISNYSYYAAITGGATALTGVIPGLGTVVATFGGAAADTALTMKYQIEMVMSLATVYGHNIESEEEKRLCLLVAGLGATSKVATDGGKNIGTKAFVRIVQENLKGSTLVAVKQVFKKVGITFTRKGFEKAIPFGVGVVIGTAANKALTVYVGSKARSFFEAT